MTMTMFLFVYVAVAQWLSWPWGPWGWKLGIHSISQSLTQSEAYRPAHIGGNLEERVEPELILRLGEIHIAHKVELAQATRLLLDVKVLCG